MNDKQLVERIVRHHDTDSYAAIVGKYSGLVYSKALSITRCGELAAEVAQQTFIKAYERLYAWHGTELGAWLSVIAMHTALDVVKGEKKRKTDSLDDRPWLETEQQDVYQEEREEQLLRMEQAMALLKDDDRRLLKLYYYERMTTDQVAQKLGQTQANVLQRLKRVRERLRREMERISENEN